MNYEQYMAKRNELMSSFKAALDANDVGKCNDLKAQIEKLDGDFETHNVTTANYNALMAGAAQPPVNIAPVPATNNSNGERVSTPVVNIDNYEAFTATDEYRKAFMNFALTGEVTDQIKQAQKFMNVDATTTTTDAAAVIPSTLLDEIIQKMESHGQVYNAVRKLNIKGGVDVPILSLKPTASWITETVPSDRQKVTADTKVSFSYYGLECKVSITVLANSVTLTSFENTIVALIAEAMIKALDIAVVKGSGSGSPLGIVNDTRIPAANDVTLSPTEFKAYGDWKKKVFAKIPLAYRTGGQFLMAAGTFEGYIDGMVDTTGQPVGRVNFNITDGVQERFGGRPVLLVEDDVITPYDAASTDDVVAIFVKLSDYAINSNMQIMMFRWLDHDKNEYVDKALLIADGKLLDPNGVILVRKGA